MPEGQWGAGDTLRRLSDVTAAAGFKHLGSLLFGSRNGYARVGYDIQTANLARNATGS